MQRMSAQFRYVLFGTLLTASCCALAQTPVKLVANPLPTMVAEAPEPARLNQLITNAFDELGIDVTLEVDRPAFSGSGLLTGKYTGEFAHLGLQERRDNLLYSKAYLPSLIYLASRKHPLDEVTQFAHIQSSRVATTNRMANTPSMRRIKSVSWVRNPAIFDMFSQLAQQRAEYVLEDRLIIDEFNRLLLEHEEQPLFVSPQPLIVSNVSISLRNDISDAKNILARFDQYISTIQQDGRYNQAMGLSWTSKDINGDGIADWITTSTVFHEDQAPMSLPFVLPLDNTKPTEASMFYIDGEAYSNWQEVQQILASTPRVARPALLDHEVYKTMMKRW